ncbi:hypothetical protein BJV85_002778 [Clostridium acetobutylicum]|uniref:Uncharacterized protein n=1 Tax=Clostridium acetobutylicum (strain ATCC 824 / DSM 792 / JCM 1419 / IAM 19013 / LMG 5710 / NBRC 13948 / NRRL B-527 / VKM B-1787 / 2291 / W) TaxID=272562 RepID=Q97JQ3_CLOAB|nr:MULTISPECIES: hypothetical protein [Clostridium]AAK79192.1 Hypothetical protein CA_C1220 [Clostridium acetobutylicum ATCC 824]ADZ20270.1 Conserved hypothetical protein [Clostridium acetobutylicum EA 2018]AEI31722.1 hypothetical protein SMB_G1240 [Clostridium acetobutylicum DSM 1731]AWV81558.1 hypothetical protein DK921_15955 [Clostridium acetobutylicum]MBC2393198.1 hypothetical protein [Clostridium acetobutylicum]
MHIKFITKKEHKVKLENYIGKPIIKKGTKDYPIGVITKATEHINDNGYITIEAEIWDKFIDIKNKYLSNENYCSISLEFEGRLK